MLASVTAIVIFFTAPACIFLYIIIFPESKACWTSEGKAIATPVPTRRTDDVETNAAELFAFWSYTGFAVNIILTACYAHALRIPCIREDLTHVGQVKIVRKIVYCTFLLILLFNTLTITLRWDHFLEVCSGDLIPEDYYKQMEEYNHKIPKFYFIRTGAFMKGYCYFYVGTFGIVSAFGFILTLWVTWKQTFKEERLPSQMTL